MGFLNNKLLPFIYSGAHLVFKINKDQNVCNKSKPFVTANFFNIVSVISSIDIFWKYTKTKVQGLHLTLIT